MKKDSNKTLIIILIIFLFLITRCGNKEKNIYNNKRDSKTLKILSSYENQMIEESFLAYAKKNKINVEFVYKGDLDIVNELNKNSQNYDAAWISNSMWLYMLDNPYLLNDSKSISVSPVVFGIRKSKAKSLGLIDKEITNNEIVDLIKNKEISYVMSSVTQTNTGATAYFGFLNALAGNPEILTKDIIDDENLQKELLQLFSGVERVSGDEDYLKTMFLNNDKYEAVIADESALININKQLKKDKKEELYLIYPTDGVALNDSTFGFINNGYDNEESFLKLQKYLLSSEGRKILLENGKRTWYGGVNENAPKDVFKTEWGIDTTKYLNVTKFPSKDVMTYALGVYIEMLRKPTHVVFLLDYSGSMRYEGIEQLRDAMNYILDYDEASKDYLQFSKKDKITVISFASSVDTPRYTNVGTDTDDLKNYINNRNVGGNTALYDAINEAFDILKDESDDYTKTVIAMTDGEINEGTFSSVKKKYSSIDKEIPVYGIMFGDASEYQLNDIARLTNGKVFDGRTNLLDAFKEVRSYN